jgi:hypothetical protein
LPRPSAAAAAVVRSARPPGMPALARPRGPGAPATVGCPQAACARVEDDRQLAAFALCSRCVGSSVPANALRQATPHLLVSCRCARCSRSSRSTRSRLLPGAASCASKNSSAGSGAGGAGDGSGGGAAATKGAAADDDGRGAPAGAGTAADTSGGAAAGAPDGSAIGAGASGPTMLLGTSTGVAGPSMCGSCPAACPELCCPCRPCCSARRLFMSSSAAST